jgi:hypothetical protein
LRLVIGWASATAWLGFDLPSDRISPGLVLLLLQILLGQGSHHLIY